MSKEDMLSAVKKSKCLCLVDATHPFAVAVTSQIKLVCAELGVKYVRLLRNIDEQKDVADSLLFFDSVKSAAEYVKDKRGNVFVASGANFPVGLITNLPSIKPTITPATGPSNGTPASIKALEAAIMPITSGRKFGSIERTVATT